MMRYNNTNFQGVRSVMLLQYLAILLLMSTLALYGFIQPYQETGTNILEVIFSINTIILLLLRGTKVIEDEWGRTFGKDKSIATGKCTDNRSINITAFAWILFPLYYSSLVITCVITTVWLTTEIRQVFR